MGRFGRQFKPVTCVVAARALRDFGDGFVAIVLPAYLLALGLTPFEVGLLSTVSLLGTACLTLAVGVFGPRFGIRQVLMAAAGLMTVTGLVFASVHVFAVLVGMAFLGTINPSAGSVSLSVPLEHAVLSGQVDDAIRTRIFARYSFAGAFAAALGALFASTPDLQVRAGIDRFSAISALFVLYAGLRLLVGLLYARIPKEPNTEPTEPVSVLGPSRSIVLRLAALFSLDAFAGGFVVQSLLALWLFERFQMSLSAAAMFFFWTGLLSALSFPVATWLSRRIGLVTTMVHSQIPSSIALILAAFWTCHGSVPVRFSC